MGAVHNDRKIYHLLLAKRLEQGVFAAMYKDDEAGRSTAYETRSALLANILGSLDQSEVGSQQLETTATVPAGTVASTLFGLVTEVGGQITVYLYDDPGKANDAERLFCRKHVDLIERGDAACDTAYIDARALFHRGGLLVSEPIVYAFIGGVGRDYTVSLHPDEGGADAARRNFKSCHHDEIAAGETWLGSHAVALPRDWVARVRKSGKSLSGPTNAQEIFEDKVNSLSPVAHGNDNVAIAAVLTGKIDELSAYAIIYQGEDDQRAVSYRAQADLLQSLYHSMGMANDRGLTHYTAPAPPHEPCYYDLTALVTDVAGQHTVYLYESFLAAGAADTNFELEHAAMIGEGCIQSHIALADIALLTPTQEVETGGRIVFAFISAIDQYYSVSLHDDEAGALAELARFRTDNADFVEAGDTWTAWHAVPLPLGWRFPAEG